MDSQRGCWQNIYKTKQIMNRDIRRGIFIPVMAISLMIMNFVRLKDSECIRAIHITTLLVMGFAFGILFMNLMTLYKNNKARNGK